MKVQGLNYYSSYILTKLPLDDILEEYEKKNINNLNLYFDKNVDVRTEEEGNKSITMLGYCFDIRDGGRSQKNILQNLLQSANLHEDLDYINGRYIFIINQDNNHFIYSDALQLKPLVYHIESKSLASHDSLLRHVLVKSNYKITRPSTHKNNSLDYTQYNEIYKYNPSLYIDYNKFEFVRFYPRSEMTNKPAEAVFEEMRPYLDQVINYLMNVKNDIFVTVTGGIDSRVSTSLTRAFSNKVEYLTYTKKAENLDTPLKKLVYRNDESITSEMKRYLGWNHTFIDLDDYKPSKEEVSTYLKTFNSRHAYSLINYYRNHKNYYKALHIKSTAFGMGKADFSKDLDVKEDTHEFYEKCLYGFQAGFKERKDYNQKIQEFFDRNLMTEGYPLGRHYYDLFYLESRMANWHSSLTLETDPETEEFILINSRKFIDFIMQPPINERRGHKLYKTIINHYWPVLLKFGINKLEKNTDTKKSISLSNIKITELYKIQLTKQDDQIIAKPSVHEISNLELYTFGITGEVGTKVTIRSYYQNEKARNKIKVIIKEDMNISSYDILDLNDGLTMDISKKGISISIVYNYDYKKSSWLHAGRLTIEKQ